MNKIEEKMLQEAKKLVGEEMTLISLDNQMREITESENDIFDYGREYWENFTWDRQVDGMPTGVSVMFTLLNPEEGDADLIVKIDSVDIL